MLPEAREDGLLVSEVDDELVVYDLTRQDAHSLNRTAALVWRGCDGRTSAAELAARLPGGLEADAGEQLVWHALGELGRKDLLKAPVRAPAGMGGLSRRALLRRLGLAGGAAFLLPAIESIAAPAPAVAASATTFCLYEVKTASESPCGGVTVGSTVCGPCVQPCADSGFIFTPINTASGVCTIGVEPTATACGSCPSVSTKLRICSNRLDRDCWRGTNP